MLTKRQSSYVESVRAITMDEHSFWKERSTETACRILMTDVVKALATPRTLLYTVFIHTLYMYFEVVTKLRNKVMFMLAEIKAHMSAHNLFAAILQENRMIIDDGVAKLPLFIKISGMAHGTT